MMTRGGQDDVLPAVLDIKAQFIRGNDISLVCSSIDVSRRAGAAVILVRGCAVLFSDRGVSVSAEGACIDEENGCRKGR